MSRELLESIINKDYVTANELFEQKLNDIRERKLYEEKRRLMAENPLPKDFDKYSAASQEKLKKGYRLLSPDERDSRRVGDEPEKKTVARKLAKAGTVIPRTLKIGDRYEKALSRAQDLEARGSRGKVAAVKKAYRPYRAAKAITTGVKKAYSGWGNVLSKGMSGNLE